MAGLGLTLELHEAARVGFAVFFHVAITFSSEETLGIIGLMGKVD